MNHQRQNQTIKQSNNLYVHFPFCWRKCAYCSLYSRVGVEQDARDEYVARLARYLGRQGPQGRMGLGDADCQLPSANRQLSTVYFGGGSPALCNLKPIFEVLKPCIKTSPYLGDSHFPPSPEATEFTVELHPLDVTDALLAELRDGGVNRISMGVQSFDDATLAAMGRGYTLAEALRAFERVKGVFDNAGIDLIVGFPGDRGWRCAARGTEPSWRAGLRRFAALGMRHCSVYSLQNERGLEGVPDDDAVLDRVRSAADELKALGLERYEISNYAVPGYECRHNLAVWRGEDYLGFGEGACGRTGLVRTRGVRGEGGVRYELERVAPGDDLKERTLFRLRTREGLDATRFPAWRAALDRFVGEGLLTRTDGVYLLTPRGAEVCDAILAEIV